MKVRYVGPDIGIDGLFDQGVYEVVEVDKISGALRIIDESDEDYLYSPVRPKPLCCEYQGGKFEIVEDDEHGSLAKAING